MSDDEWNQYNRSVAEMGGYAPDPLSRGAQEGQWNRGEMERQRAAEELHRRTWTFGSPVMDRPAESPPYAGPMSGASSASKVFGIVIIVGLALGGLAVALASRFQLPQASVGQERVRPQPVGNPYPRGSRAYQAYEFAEQLRRQPTARANGMRGNLPSARRRTLDRK